MKVDVLIELYDGVLEDVRILSHKKAEIEWNKWAKEEGYENYDQFIQTIDEGRADSELRWFEDVEVDI